MPLVKLADNLFVHEGSLTHKIAVFLTREKEIKTSKLISCFAEEGVERNTVRGRISYMKNKQFISNHDGITRLL